MAIKPNATQIAVYETLLCPEGIVINEAYPDRSAINSVAIITGKGWQDLVRSLIEQAHFRCNMPSYKTCITDMLRAHGFKPIRGYFGLGEILGKMNAEITPGKKYIVKIGYGAYYALVPDPIIGKYILKGCRPYHRLLDRFAVDEVWEYFPGTDNRTGITRRSESRRRQKEAAALENRNENPAGRLIGDCVVRALATVLECSWHEAVDILAETSAYTDPQINSTSNINKTLKRLGFEMHAGVKSGRGFVSAANMCYTFNRLYQNGERIFAYLGTHHCAAILPVESGGKTGYKIQDTWDSTSRDVVEYWVLKHKGSEKKQETVISTPAFAVGTVIKHPAFGEGVVISVIGDGPSKTLEIEFPAAGIKKISAAWLEKNSK